jgi:type II secretory pathway component PulL
LQSVAFRSGRLELDLEADQLATLDKLKQSLEKNGQLSATIQSANQEQGKVRGRVRVEARS